MVVVCGAIVAVGCAKGTVNDTTFGVPMVGGGDTEGETEGEAASDTEVGSDGSGPGDTDSGPSMTDGTGDEPTTGGEACGGVTCDPNAICDLETCVCDPGFEGDGLTCTDIDGCAGEPCFAGAECTDVAAPDEGYTCGDCPAGTEGDGENCTDVDGCIGDPCFSGVACEDVVAPGEGFMCGDCPAGYEGDGIACADIDGCMGSPCYPGVACSDVAAPADGFTCGSCPAGLYGDGISCLSPSMYSVGGLTTTSTATSYFRANAFVASSDGTLAEFEQYLGLSGLCSLDFYVFEAAGPAGVLSQIWRGTVVAPASTGYQASGIIDVPTTSGNYYVLGVGWNCTATYYYQGGGGWAGVDVGIGAFENNRWDNAYSGASDFYIPPNTGTSSTAYAQRIYFAD